MAGMHPAKLVAPGTAGVPGEDVAVAGQVVAEWIARARLVTTQPTQGWSATRTGDHDPVREYEYAQEDPSGCIVDTTARGLG